MDLVIDLSGIMAYYTQYRVGIFIKFHYVYIRGYDEPRGTGHNMYVGGPTST